MENERKRDSISYEDFAEQHKKRKSIKNMSEIISYLNLHNLYFKADHSEGKNCDRCPDYITEGCIWFYENSMEVRVIIQNWVQKYVKSRSTCLNYIDY